MAYRASYGSEKIGQERISPRRHEAPPQSIDSALLCLMVGSLQEVRAAWTALLPKSSLRKCSEWLRLPGSRSNWLIFAQPTRIVCLLRLHCAQLSAGADEQVQTWNTLGEASDDPSIGMRFANLNSPHHLADIASQQART